MALPEGTRLGPYEIGGLLGSGGMGEVYRARDPRLGRNVAIKILPTELSRDAERLWRFEREARAVASLNHPHICTVYDIGEGFLVMELLEGQTLQERLKAGPLATPLLVDLALQIADALEAAHGAEIIHRDLKPENIFITTRSEAKLLDFGLAKLAGDAADNETIAELQLGQGPTFLHPRGETSIGTLLGTAAYMSPEQARGEPADAQSDLFSFGAVLYEMATGRPAFSGRTLAVLFDSILNKDPKPVAELNPAIPAELTHVIDKALEKERDLRYRTAADMRTDLKRLRRDAGPRPIVRDDGEAPAVSAATRPASGPPHVSDSAVLAGVVKRHRWSATALGVIALAAVIAVAYGFWSRGRAGGGAPVSLDSLQVTQLTSTGIASRPAISPDGKYIVYLQPEPAGGTSVWLRQTDATSGVRIMPPDNRGTPPRAATIGPDNAFVDVLRGGSIWRMPLLGGDAKLMLENALTPVAWAPDGQRLSVIRFTPGSPGSDLVVTDREGQNAQVVANRVAPNGFVTLGLPGTAAVAPAWAPDGRRIAAIQRFGEDVRDLGVVIFDVSSDTTEVVNIRGDAPQGLAWLDDRTLLIGQALETGTASQLWRVSVPDGHRSRLTNDVNRYSDLSVTADRNVLVTSRPEVRLSVWAGDAKGGSGREVVAPAPFLSSAVQYATVAWDGARLLFTHTLNGRFEIFRLDVDRAGATPEVVVAGREMSAAPDGTIVFRSVVDEGGLWKANRDGRERVQLAKGSISYPFISANGRQVVFNGPTDTGQLLFVVPVSGGTPVPVVKDPISIAGFSDISPDGRLVAFARNDRWVVCELPSCSAEKTAGIPMGSRPRWMPDGKGLAYVEGRTGTNIWVQPLDASPPYALTHFTDGKTIGHYAFSSDGKRLAVSRETSTIDIVLFRGLRGQR